MKGYGSTNCDNDGANPPTPSSRNLSGASYKSPTRRGNSLPRNFSNSAETSHTQESDPLLGERYFISSDSDNVKVNFGVSCTPGGFESAPDLGRSKNPNKATSRLDPHIGHNVVVTDDLDTLAYSFEHDDSTFKHFLEEVEEKKRGLLNRLAGTEPALTLVCLGLAVGIAICVFPALLYVKYQPHQGTTPARIPRDGAEDTATKVYSAWNGVPFQKISRAAFGDPVSNFLDKSLFHPSLLYNGEGIDVTSAESSVTTQNTGNNNERRLDFSFKPFLRRPFPTGAFWTNLVLLPQTESGKPKASTITQSSYPIVAYPYSYQWSPLGKLQVSYSASRRKTQSNSIQDAFAADMTIGSVDNIHTRHVLKFDSLSVTLRFYGGVDDTTNSNNFDDMKHWDTYIVQGSPYVTARYYGLYPELTAISDFTDIVCPPLMKTEEERQSAETNYSKLTDHQSRRRMGFSSQSSSPVASSTSSKKFGVCGISESSTQQQKIITGVQFVVTTQEGQIWLVFASEPITFEFNKAARRVIKSSQAFQGVIRLALVPPPLATLPTGEVKVADPAPLDFEQIASSSGVKRLIYHAGTFPIGGTVNWSFHSGSRAPLVSSLASSRRRALKIIDSGGKQLNDSERQLSSSLSKGNNIGSISFTFDTMHMSSLESVPINPEMELLMLSLPHHAASLSSAGKILFNPQEFDLFFHCIKGRMVPVVGNSWTYEEELTSVGFDEKISNDTKTDVDPVLSLSTLDQSIRDLLLQTVESDLIINLPVLESGAYGFGKGIARLAQLAMIADAIEGANAYGKHIPLMNVTTAKNESQVSHSTSLSPKATSQRAYGLLEKHLTMWLIGDRSNPHLLYDVDLGGIISKDGSKDVFSDFGNVRYNGKNKRPELNHT